MFTFLNFLFSAFFFYLLYHIIDGVHDIKKIGIFSIHVQGWGYHIFTDGSLYNCSERDGGWGYEQMLVRLCMCVCV